MALVAPFIENISSIVTEFAISNINTNLPPGKKPHTNTSQVTHFVPRATKTFDTPRPILPHKPQVSASQWATVARKVAKLPDPPVNLVKRRPATQAKAVRQENPKEDKRLFLRIGHEYLWRKLLLVTTKKIVTERSGVASSAIIAMTQVRLGLAIKCASDALRETILKVSPSFQKENKTIEPTSNWTSVIVPHVPIYIRAVIGRIEVTRDMIKAECQATYRVTSIKVQPNNDKLG